MKPTRIEQRGAVTSVWFDESIGTLDLLLTSDRHHDSIKCNRELEKKHLDEALQKDALIIDAGDLFDAMQGKFDPRRSYDELRPEYRTERYYDVVVEDAAKFYAPYAGNMLVLGHGNHETAVTKNCNIDLHSHLLALLRNKNPDIKMGGYGGWVVFYFGLVNGSRSSVRLKYFHGSGGEAPVTRGTIQTSRQAVYLPDADIVLNGHSHNEYTLTIKRERISTKGVQYFDNCHFARTPGYKDDYGDGQTGWDVQRGGVPKPMGCIWARIDLERAGSRIYPHITLTSDVR